VEARVLGVQDREYFQKLRTGTEPDYLPEHIELVLAFNDDDSVHPKAVKISDALAAGAKLAQGRSIEQYLHAIDPKAPAFLIYTSGTTGNPKGAILSQDNLAFTSDAISKLWDLKYADGSLFSFLPLCHIAEKLQCIGVGISNRYLVSFCTKFDNVATELTEVEPTLLLCVPRLWEKMMEGVMAKVEKGTGLKKILAAQSLALGARMGEARMGARSANPVDSLLLPIAERLVLSKVKQALGLRRAAKLASGAAPLPAQVSRWFRSLGLEILECYGLTESTGVISVTIPGKDCAGTVGLPVPEFEFQIAEDGEILSKGRNIFLGYFKDDAATAQTLENGWLRTGDLAERTQTGYVRIRGRKKEIMKTSGGKMVAPVPIEERIKTHSMISQVCMVGDNRKFFSALMTLSESTLADLKARGAIPSANGQVSDSAVMKAVKQHLDEVNKTLAQYEQIKRFAILDREFSIEEGEMTPTLKMKRSVIESRFKALIDAFYQ
jgi:long-chain acyl-CoA synthetase